MPPATEVSPSAKWADRDLVSQLTIEADDHSTAVNWFCPPFLSLFLPLCSEQSFQDHLWSSCDSSPTLLWLSCPETWPNFWFASLVWPEVFCGCHGNQFNRVWLFFLDVEGKTSGTGRQLGDGCGSYGGARIRLNLGSGGSDTEGKQYRCWTSMAWYEAIRKVV